MTAGWADRGRPLTALMSSWRVTAECSPRGRRTSPHIGGCNMRRILIAVIVLVVAGVTATGALANSPHFKKGREPSCRIAVSAISKSDSCRRVFARLAAPVGVPDDNNGGSLPYDEFGLGANQPNQPHVGSVGPGTERAAAGL